MKDEGDKNSYLLLINSARRGDIDARNSVALDPSITEVCKVIWRNKVYRRNKDLDDLIQIARWKILAGIGSVKNEFESVECFNKWLYVSIRNDCLSAFRKDRVLSDARIEDAENPDGLLYQSAREYAQSALAEMSVFEIRAKVRTMPRLSQQIFYLYFGKGYRRCEIVKEIGCCRPTVQRHIEKILKLLAPYNPNNS